MITPTIVIPKMKDHLQKELNTIQNIPILAKDDTVVLSKLEFYDFTYKDFMKIKSDLLPYLEKIITDVE